MQIVEYTLPAHIVTAVINDDFTGLTPNETSEWQEFTAEQMKEQFYATFIVCAPDGPEFFSNTNDLNNLADNCYNVPVITNPLQIGGKNVADMYPPYSDATGRVVRMHYRNNCMAYGYTKDGLFCLIGTTEPIAATVAEIIFESEHPQDVEKAFKRELQRLP